MVFEHIDRLKREYTDKFVIVDASRPELRRFQGQTGVVKTVNMNGKALVQFDAFDNIGWYDIDPSFLTVVDQPPPKPAKAEPAVKPKVAAEKKSPSAAPPAETAPAAGPAKMSTADILAAARAKTAAGPTAVAAGAASVGATSAKTSDVSKPAETPKKTASKMSVEDILAAARGQKAAATSVAPAEPDVSSDIESAPSKTPRSQVAVKPSPAEVVPSETAPTSTHKGDQPLPKDVAGIVAYCRKHDGKS